MMHPMLPSVDVVYCTLWRGTHVPADRSLGLRVSSQMLK